MMKAIFLIFYVTCCFSFTSSFSGLSGLSDGSSSSKTKNQNVWILTSLYRELEKCMLLLIFCSNMRSYFHLLSFQTNQMMWINWRKGLKMFCKQSFENQVWNSRLLSKATESNHSFACNKHCKNNLTILRMMGRRKLCVQDEWGWHFFPENQ